MALDDVSLDATGPGLGDSAGAIVNSVLGPVLGTLFGGAVWNQLFGQAESDFKQYSENQTDRSQWTLVPTDSSTPSYYFLLKYKGKTLQIPFALNPQKETISEPHASTTTVTQGGGKIIQSEGSVLKDIVISGQVGFYPNQPNVTPLPTSGIGSGLEGFKFLQNVFRRYCFLRKFGDLTQGLQLIYVNRRRQESWVVNPLNFTSEDATEHQNNFSYNITLETLYPYDGADSKGLVENLLDSVPGWQALNTCAQTLAETVDAVNAAAGQISAVVNSFSNVLLQPLIQLSNAFADVTAGRLANISNFNRNSIQALVYNLQSVQANLEAANQNQLAYTVALCQRAVTMTLLQDNLFNTTPQQNIYNVASTQQDQLVNYEDGLGNSVSPGDAQNVGLPSARPDASSMFGGTATAPNALPGSATYQAEEQAVLNAQGFVTSVSIGGAAIQPNGTLSYSRFTENPNEILTATPPPTAQISAGLNWYASWDQSIANIDPSNSDYRTTMVQSGDDIQTIAMRVLGDSGRWPELVLLNNLRYPYVADPSYVYTYSTLASDFLRNATQITIGSTAGFPSSGTVSIGSPGSSNYETWTYQSISGNSLVSSFPLRNTHSVSERVQNVQANVTNVIAYGNAIKYPVSKQTPTATTRVWRNETTQSLALSPFERSLGSDIYINPVTAEGQWAGNDLVLAYGIQNLQQFMRFCVVVKKNTYRRAARAGFSQYVGLSVGASSAMVTAEGQTIFLGDDRITTTSVVQVNQVGGTLQIGMAAYVRDQEDPVTTPMTAI